MEQTDTIEGLTENSLNEERIREIVREEITQWHEERIVPLSTLPARDQDDAS